MHRYRYTSQWPKRQVPGCCNVRMISSTACKADIALQMLALMRSSRGVDLPPHWLRNISGAVRHTITSGNSICCHTAAAYDPVDL